MNQLIALICFVVVVAVLWWALNVVLTVMAVPSAIASLVVVAFVLIAVISALSYISSGTWFWFRR